MVQRSRVRCDAGGRAQAWGKEDGCDANGQGREGGHHGVAGGERAEDGEEN